MKGRSQRPAAVAAPAAEDWGDGSWTVDCSCGVTFDDGEEMVSCDECGVWVHTRCSRFTRGAASFACHKCTAAAASSPADHEMEAEVAQLLAELPTKTYDSSPLPPPPIPPPLPQRGFRLWAEVPMDNRVHVQGVPGGDAGLFHGISSVFTSELWKCAGYVPKKFNFQYREFPCWDEEDAENPANRGADVLFSLSKEIAPYVPIRGFDRRADPEVGRKQRDGRKTFLGGRSQGSAKERNRIRFLGVNSSKRRKDEAREGIERTVRKKARSGVHRGSFHVVDMNKTDPCEDGSVQVPESNDQDANSEDRREGLQSEPSEANHSNQKDNDKKPRHVVLVKHSKGGFPDEAQKGKCLTEAPIKDEKHNHREAVRTDYMANHVPSASPQEEDNDAFIASATKEDARIDLHCLKQPKDEGHYEEDARGSLHDAVTDSVDLKPSYDVHKNSGSCELNVPKLPDSSVACISNLDKSEVKSERVDDQDKRHGEISFLLMDQKLLNAEDLIQSQEKLIGSSVDDLQQHSAISSLSCGQNFQDAKKELHSRNQGCDKTMDEIVLTSKTNQNLQALEAGGSLLAEKSEVMQRIDTVDEPTQTGGPNMSHPVPSAHKLVGGAGRVSSASSPQGTTRSISGNYMSPVTTTSFTALKDVQLTKEHEVKVHICTNGTKDSGMPIVSSESTNIIKGSSFLESKSSQQTNKSSSGTASKLDILDSREKSLGSSSKLSSGQNIVISSGRNEVIGSSQGHSSSVQIKLKSSGPSQKNEKHNHPIPPPPPSKVFSNSLSMYPAGSAISTTTLSDEELALLLHQELNSSPRVPRVPRMRQAAGMQLCSPTGTSMLSKRSSSSGGKDQLSVTRRKNKDDSARDSSRNSRDIIDETKRTGRLTSPVRKHQESAFVADASSKKDVRSNSPDTVTSANKIAPITSSAGVDSCLASLSEAHGQTIQLAHSSSQDVSEDDVSIATRTLPGLIDEIMKKGKRMTYEELCDAVRPHWRKLRKPNGERYAYSTHSQAVLDCLRNRNEWAHLIDRGPKTNSSKKRRKLDPDTPAVESENEGSKSKKPKETEDKNVESHREDFPKGRRKARKRRRLELQGRSVNDRKRQKQDGASDDDLAGLSHTTSNEGTEGLCSEDEVHGSGPCDPSDSSSDNTD